MKHEPALDRRALAEVVRAAYGLDVRSMTFVPVGYATACYVLDCGMDGQRFLKVWPDTVAGRTAAARRDRVLPLLRALCDRGLVEHVTAPLATKAGPLSAEVETCSLALFPFVDGRTPRGWPRWGRARWEALGRTMAAIHTATPALADVLPPSWSPDAPFAADVVVLLGLLEGMAEGARSGLPALREALLPRRAEVLAQLERLAAVQARCARQDAPLVLCHADLGGDNILVDARGAIWALDWDDATLAPPELDLRVGVEGGHVGSFLRAYRAAGGTTVLSRDRFELFLLSRALGDAHARLDRLLREEVLPSEAQELIDGIERWGFGEWRALDARLGAIDAEGLRGSNRA